MVGMSVVGFATVGTNLVFMFAKAPAPKDYLKEHVKAIVGAGISVYTAFFAFGAVRFMPAIALHPGLWAIPLVVGLAIILVHRHRIGRGQKSLAA
jgi:cadmium resistance protein CadD (predicted permease)